MGTRTITITNEAYERLAANKGPKDSFSDVVMKLTKKSSLRGFVGLFPKEKVDELEKNISKMRKESIKLSEERMRRLYDY